LLGGKLREVATPDELWITASHSTGLCRSERCQRIVERILEIYGAESELSEKAPKESPKKWLGVVLCEI
jgi:hypothetical protein